MGTNTVMRKMGAALVVLAIGLTNGFSQSEDPGAPRLWRATSGHALKAAFVEIKAGGVVLKTEDGQLRSVPLNLLLPSDQATAKAFSERIASGGNFPVKAAAPGGLPAFTAGPGKGLFAFYTNANFMVRVTDKAVATIICLEDGKPVGKPIHIRTGYTVPDPKIRDGKPRAIASFDAGPGPLLQPRNIALTGLLADNVRFGYQIAIEDNAIHTWGWAEDPPGIALPTRCTSSFVFPASHSFEAHVLVVDQKAAVKDLSLALKPLKGKDFTLPYGEIPREYDIPLRSATVEGPVFGTRRVRIDVGSSRNAEMRCNVGSGSPLYRGYTLRLTKKDAAARDDTARITLTIK